MNPGNASTYYIVRYDAPNGRPSRKFYDIDDALISAESRAFSFWSHQKDADKNPEMIEVTEQRIR